MIKYANSQDPTYNAFNEFLKNYGVFIALGIAFLLAAIIVVVLLIHFKANKNKDIAPVHEPIINVSVYKALGGKNNVLHHERNGSRIALSLKDDSLVNPDKLKGIGVDSIIKMSNKIILVVKHAPAEFYKLFN